VWVRGVVGVGKLQADHAVVGAQRQQLQGREDPELDPLVAAVAVGMIAGVVGQRRSELVPQRVDEPGWWRRHKLRPDPRTLLVSV
jgi:hypothetical protein